MNYIIFVITEAYDGTFTIGSVPVSYKEQFPDIIYEFTNSQLSRLYDKLQEYHLGSGIYFYRSVEAFLELQMCEDAEYMLTMLSWRYN